MTRQPDNPASVELAELDVVTDADGRTGTIILLPGTDGGALVEYQLNDHVWESHWRDPATLRKVTP